MVLAVLQNIRKYKKGYMNCYFKFALLLLINTSFIKAMEEEESNPFNFEGLPNEIKATIVGFLAEDRTFEQAMESFCSIAHTNKEFQEFIADGTSANRYCKKLVKRFPEATRNNPMIPGLFLSVFSRNEKRLDCIKTIKELASGNFEMMASTNKAINKGDTEFIKAVVTTIPALRTYFAKHYKYGDEQYTALMWACSYGHKRIVEQLLNAGANPEVKTTGSMHSALHYASRGNYASIVEILLQNNARVDEKNRSLATPLMFTVYRGYPEVVEILLKYQADYTLKDIYGDDSLRFLEQGKGDGLAVARKFIDAEARENKVVGGSRIPLLIQATRGGLFKVMAAFLKAGASPNVHDLNGNTPLIIATNQGSLERVHLLLEEGADPEIHTISGQTALSIAKAKGYKEIVRLLQEKQFKKGMNVGAVLVRRF